MVSNVRQLRGHRSIVGISKFEKKFKSRAARRYIVAYLLVLDHYLVHLEGLVSKGSSYLRESIVKSR